MVIILLLILIAIFAPVHCPLSGHAISDTNRKINFFPPSRQYLFGTDEIRT
jgi:ABC-type dipeptide/oligopeptide/nickel transport system permease subunit